MAVPFQSIAQGINFLGNVVNNIFNLLDFLNPLSENFILKGVLSHFSSLLEYVNPLSENFFLIDVLNFLLKIISYINPLSENFILKGVLSHFSSLLGYINPFGENFFGYKIGDLFRSLFEDLFVPSYDHFSDFNQIYEEKFGIISQIKDLISTLFSFRDTVESEIPPSFNITYMGVTVSIIDFSILAKFRTTLHAIICAVLWVPFIIRLLKRLPAIIDGFEGNYKS